MAKQIPLRLPEDLYKRIKTSADSNSLSVNQFIVSALTESISGMDESAAEESAETINYNSSDKMVTYRFPESYATLLHKKAGSLGLTDTAYLRQMIRSKDFKRIDYSLNDLWEYIAQSQRLIDSVVRFVELIDTSGKGQVFEQDVRRILSLLEEIRTMHKEQIKLTHSNREAVYRKMIRKIEDAL